MYLQLYGSKSKNLSTSSSVCEFLLLCHCTYLSPPSSTAVRVTLTNDLNKIFKSLQSLEPKGKINFVTGIRIAHVSNYIHTLVAVYMYMSTCAISFVTIPKYLYFSAYEGKTPLIANKIIMQVRHYSLHSPFFTLNHTTYCTHAYATCTNMHTHYMYIHTTYMYRQLFVHMCVSYSWL